MSIEKRTFTWSTRHVLITLLTGFQINEQNRRITWYTNIPYTTAEAIVEKALT